VPLEAEEMRHEKKTSESKHPSSCSKRGKIELEAYGKDIAERGLNKRDRR
jgi:hypothetical protein